MKKPRRSLSNLELRGVVQEISDDFSLLSYQISEYTKEFKGHVFYFENDCTVDSRDWVIKFKCGNKVYKTNIVWREG